MKTALGAAVVLSLAPCLAFAQTDQMPKPGPEVQKLGYYLGSWRGHGETKGGPFGPAGKLSSKITCDWFAGKFHMICRGEETGPTGTRAFMEIKDYDPQAKAYTAYSISNRGESEYNRGGTLAGNTLTYLINQNAGGKKLRIRYTEVRVSPALYTYKAEASIGGKPWTTIAEGEIAKVK